MHEGSFAHMQKVIFVIKPMLPWSLSILGSTCKPHDITRKLNEWKYETNLNVDNTTMDGPLLLLVAYVFLVYVFACKCVALNSGSMKYD